MIVLRSYTLQLMGNLTRTQSISLVQNPGVKLVEACTLVSFVSSPYDVPLSPGIFYSFRDDVLLYPGEPYRCKSESIKN